MAEVLVLPSALEMTGFKATELSWKGRRPGAALGTTCFRGRPLLAPGMREEVEATGGRTAGFSSIAGDNFRFTVFVLVIGDIDWTAVSDSGGPATGGMCFESALDDFELQSQGHAPIAPSKSQERCFPKFNADRSFLPSFPTKYT